ncbi:hypothetical protein KO561_18350 [Radiobacillus kanasensis]|uniref:hypothetical protein n=1 Tax=Radiobacillus kanasensis TaxID=2844358 RepID=UPI001E2B17A2|nr:hypothetical protein [Radiobacillus kanasensis]UFT99116.1 hypothetical protein KO561_18350 [Radiobacillus kanasensis]
MHKHFHVVQDGLQLSIKKVSDLPLHHYGVYMDYQLIASFHNGQNFYLDVSWLQPGEHHLMIVGYRLGAMDPMPIAEQYTLSVVGARNLSDVERNFRAGDILVASDNVNEAITGYVGHSAIVVDDHNLIESPGGYPAIRKATIQQFLEKHPVHAQFRPNSKEKGLEAVQYAEQYLDEYKQNIKDGKDKPTFSFMAVQDLEDPWEYIYCSKLVWLSYANGANYKFNNDYLWFSPEDLYNNLLDNQDFKTIYRHGKIDFKLNT